MKRYIIILIIAVAAAGYVFAAHAWVFRPFRGVMPGGLGGITVQKACDTIRKEHPFALINPNSLENPTPDHVQHLWQFHECRARTWVALAFPCVALCMAAAIRWKIWDNKALHRRGIPRALNADVMLIPLPRKGGGAGWKKGGEEDL